MSNTNSPPGYNINKFVPGQTGVIQFQVHSLNLQMPKDLKTKFEYTFWIINFYLVQPAKKHNFLTLSKRKCGFEE